MDIKKCDECGSKYYKKKSKMSSLCPECAHYLYGYQNCNHEFIDGKCKKCFWNGINSAFIRNLKKQNNDENNK